MKTLVIISFFAAVFCGFGHLCYASSPRGDGALSLYSYRSNEAIQVVIHRSGTYDAGGLAKVNHLMRCRGNDHVFPIDQRLIDLIDHIQDHFGADTIEVISGYRSPEFNNKLKKEGHNVARESLHMKGMATDIHIDEISEEAIWNYVKSLGVGGAGLYPCYDFVHIDVGRTATWGEPDCTQRKLVGLDNNPNPDWQITTNKNNYRRSDVVGFTVNPPKEILRANHENPSMIYAGKAHLEKFHRGTWTKQKDFDFALKTFTVKDLPYGKYRIVYSTNPPAYSNEFYIKKR